MLEELKEFFKIHGHTYVPSKDKNHEALFEWVCKVRSTKQKQEEKLIVALDHMGFDWTPHNSFDQLWLYRFFQLKDFIREHGHTRVPYNYKKCKSLGAWVHTQRRSELLGKIDQARKEMLDEVDFAWCKDIKKEKKSNWEKMYGKLLAYHKKYGDTNIPSGWEKDPQLARWVSRQREIRKKIPDEHKEKLDAIGFEWSIRDTSWEVMFDKLKAFYEKEGHSLVPHHYEGSTRLSEWVYRQRQYTHRLSEEQIEKLNKIDFVWKEGMEKLQDKNWRKMFGELKAFHKTHGHSRVPSHSKKYPRLSSWVLRQRSKKKTLEKWKLEKLDQVDFQWSEDIRKEKRKNWIFMYSKLKKFKAEKGHCNVPSFFEEDEKLGRWVETQRIYRKKMEQWKIDMLEKIGFKWSEDIQESKKKRWYRMYDKLAAFYKTYGHSRVPEYWEEDPELSLWVIGQRRPKKPHSAERRRLLDAVKFVWNNESPTRERDDKGRFKPTIEKMDVTAI